MVARADFDPSIALPPGLEIGQVRRAVEYVGIRDGKPVPENGS